MCKKARFFLSFVRPTYKAHYKNSRILVYDNCFVYSAILKRSLLYKITKMVTNWHYGQETAA